MRRLTTEEFIERAKAAHGDKYDYSKVRYVNNKTEVTITCPHHGDFEKRPDKHLLLQGCPVCSVDRERTGKAKSVRDFAEDALSVHGDKYSYDKVRYANSKTKVTITCPLHGDFEQTPSNHLSGKRCSKCTGNGKKDAEGFIRDALSVHGDKYSYDKVRYANSKTKVTITCPLHGDFEQRAGCHLSGKGCQKCYSFTGRTVVYLVHIESHGEEMLKIGITNRCVEQRFNDHQYPDQHVTEIASLEFKERSDAKTIEAYLHTKHKRHQFTPKVKFAGHTECFNIEALETIRKDFGV